MLGFGLGYITVFFVASGICLFFVIAWIFQSEKMRNIFRDEAEGLRTRLESVERNKSALLEEIEDSEDTVEELEESVELPQLEGGGHGGVKELMKAMAGKLKSLEGEKESLKTELGEAKGALEKVYKAMHEEKPTG